MNPVERHYARDGLLAAVLTAVAEAGGDPDRLDPIALRPFDQLHGRGIAATGELAAAAELRPGLDILDLGCGLGGSARYLAAVEGCRVTAIDLTEAYLAVAQDLTERCGLEGSIAYCRADALALPFADGRFDRVWCHNVTMNIADRRGLAAELARVLRPGGKLALAEIAAGPAGDPWFPMPWAADARSSFLASPMDLRSTLEEAHLTLVAGEDCTSRFLEAVAEAKRRAEQGLPPVQAVHKLLGEDFLIAARNLAKSAYEGRVVEHFVVAEKRPTASLRWSSG